MFFTMNLSQTLMLSIGNIFSIKLLQIMMDLNCLDMNVIKHENIFSIHEMEARC